MTPQTNIPLRAWVEITLLAFLWGGSFLSVAVALQEIGPLSSVAHRVGWAMLVLWAFVLIRRIPLPKDPKIWGAFLVMGLLNNVIPFGLMAWGQLFIESGLTSILNAATAIFGVLIAAFFFADERLTTRKLVGSVIGFAGVTTAIGLENLTELDITSVAQLAILAGAMSYGFAGVWARKTLTGLEPQVAAAGMLTGSTLIMLPLAWVVEGPLKLDLSLPTLVAVGYYAVFATALAYLLYYRVLAQVGSGNLMLVTLLVAPVAIILGALVLGEQLRPSAFAGFVLLALGLLIIDGRIWRLIDRTKPQR